MVDREVVVRQAREKLGVLSRTATGEYAMLAKLLEPDEDIRAMVLAQVGRKFLSSASLLVATDRRLLVVSKGWLTRRERTEVVDLARVTGGRAERTGLVLEVDGEPRRFSYGAPTSQVAAMIAAVARESDRFGELTETARRKFGRTLGFGLEAELLALNSELDADEPLLDLAYATEERIMLIAVCATRLVLVPQQTLRKAPEPTTIIDLATVTGVEADDGDLVVTSRDGRHVFRRLLPAGAAPILAGRIAARLPGRD